MSIYAISDLHLSFNADKPMDIFGWQDYENKIKEDWKSKVKEDDLVILGGDFSWSMQLQDTYKDFEFIHNLPGKKLLLKGNHDYWWGTLTSMRRYIKNIGFTDIDFIYNNSYEFEDKIICGTRGWNFSGIQEEDEKIYNREKQRLKLSLEDGDYRLLEAAAMLHDTGTHIAYSKHHKHSYYLIMNTELPGFNDDEIAELVEKYSIF